MRHSGADLGYIRRFGRCESITFARYLHFDGEILRLLSHCLMQLEGLTSQLKVCDGYLQKITLGKKGEAIDLARRTNSGQGSEGNPPNLGGHEKRT